MGDTGDPAIGLFFSVSIDQHDLGSFVSCDGLGVEVEVHKQEEGGNHGFVHQLPGRLKYSNVTLTRPINRDSGKVAQWFASMATFSGRTSARITARRPDGSIVAAWDLVDVIPVRWKGPQLGVDSNKVATETLELAHHGFLSGAPDLGGVFG